MIAATVSSATCGSRERISSIASGRRCSAWPAVRRGPRRTMAASWDHWDSCFVRIEQQCVWHSRAGLMTLAAASGIMEVMSLDLPARPTTGVRASLRRFADAAVTPLDLDDVLDHFHPLRASSELRGRVVAVRPETAQSATIV